MAKINNQAVMQKLIDELKLYPGRDMIPSELADKILAVYQVNSQDVQVSEGGDYKSQREATLNDSDKSIVVPAQKRWKILSLGVHYSASADAGNRYLIAEVFDKDDNLIFVHQINWAIAANKVIQLNYVNTSDNWNEVNLGGSYGATRDIHFDLPLILLPGQYLRIRDVEAVAAAADDMLLTWNYVEFEE